jgi:mannose-1-phosphate guanylyltransferase
MARSRGKSQLNLIMANIYAVIMAGGRGERFWPQSRPERPKHLLPIVGSEPMVTQTVKRLGSLIPPERIFIITNVRHVEAVCDACPMVPRGQVVGEPLGRDTAAAAALAALLVRQQDANGLLALLPADAAVHDAAGYCATLQAALAISAEQDEIVTIGIKPTQPATGYGYLRLGGKLGMSEGRPWFRVERFVEKPDLATAERYLAEGIYLWNGGMFVAKAAVLEEAFRCHAPAVAEGIAKIAPFRDPVARQAALEKTYPELPKISVDYAVMEKAPNVAVIEAGFDWDDVGEWPAVARHWPADAAGNVVRGTAVLDDAGGNIVIGEPGHMLALLGVKDLVVVQTATATLICPKDRAQELKRIVQKVEGAGGQPPRK